MKYALTLICTLLFINSNTIIGQTKSVTSSDTSSEEKMIFLSYHIKESNNNNLDIAFIKQFIAEGRIKGFDSDKEYDESGNLECVLLDNEYKTLETLYIENPLEKVIEFVNDSGNLEKRLVILDKTDFTFRMPFPDKAEYVRIQLLSNSETQNFVLTKL